MQHVEIRSKHHGSIPTLTCPRDFWDFMFALGGAFGWRPLGTSYHSLAKKPVRPIVMRRHDYRPGSWSDAKQIADVDALAWSGALRRALDSSHLSNMIEAHYKIESSTLERDESLIDVHVRGCVDRFMTVLHRGGILFATRDRDQPIVNLSAPIVGHLSGEPQ